MSPSEARPWFLMHSERQNQNSENERTTRLDQLSRHFNIHYINCTDKVTGFLIAIIGLLTSLWADCILVVTCTQEFDKYASMELFVEKTIIHTSQLSHFLIVLTGTAGLLYGIKVKNKAYFTPWLFIKVIELCVLLLGIIFLVTGGTRRYIGIIPFGICFLMIGLYILLCVFHTYRNGNMESEELHGNLEDIMVNSNNQILDPPPSYDSYTVHSLPIINGSGEEQWRHTSVR